MFKKILAAVLAAAMIAVVFVGCISVSADTGDAIFTHFLNRKNGEKTSVSEKASYKLELSGAEAVSGLADDGKKLTDGVLNSYVALSASGKGKATITIDLGYAKEAIADFEIRALNDKSLGAVLPTSVKLSVSVNGSKYIEIQNGGEIESNPADKTVYPISFMPTDGVTIRYICFTVEFTGKLYIDEAAAYTYLSVEDVKNLGGGDQYSDKQGVIYKIPENSGTAQLVGYFNQFSAKVTGKATTNAYSMNTTTNGSDAKSSPTLDINDNDITEYYIGVGAEDYPDGVKVCALYLPVGARSRPGHVTQKKYVVMHNTGTYAAYTDGRHMFEYCFAAQTNRDVSWHYSVGADGIYQQLPDNESAWHDSSGTYGKGNYYGIGIENCVNGFPGYKDLNKYWEWVETTFRTVCKNVALLTAELCKRHNMDPGDCTLGTAIRQHWDSNQKNCPMEMRYNTATGAFTRDEGEMWVYWVCMVQRYWKGINGGGEYTTYEMKNTDNEVTDVIVPQNIRLNGTLYKVTYASANCFMNKTPLTSVALPSTITQGIFTKVFYLSSNLKAINVQEDSTYLSSKDGKLIYNKKEIIPEGYDASYAKSYIYPTTKKDAPTVIQSDETMLKGDVDGSGKIDATDYILVKRQILQISVLSDDAFKAADMDENGKLDATDYIAIKRIILGLA